jgi:hypothetical protein
VGRRAWRFGDLRCSPPAVPEITRSGITKKLADGEIDESPLWLLHPRRKEQYF